MTDTEKLRERFEEECAEWEMDTSRDSEGDYVDRQTRRGWNLWQAATAYAGAATPKAAQGGVGGRLHQIAAPAGDELPESVIDAVAEALGDAYDCGRVWNAWGYGSMGPDDFSVVAEDAERVAEIARAAINADRAMRAQAAPVAVAVPSYPSITLDFKQAAELLKMFGGEPGLVTLQQGDARSHSGAGLYAYYSELPEEGAEFLGPEPDDEAAPTNQTSPQPPVAAQEPAAYLEKITGRICEADDVHRRKFPACYVPLYTHPAQQPSPAAQGDAKDAARYRLLRRGQHLSVINGTGDTLRADELDTAIDAARAQAKEGA